MSVILYELVGKDDLRFSPFAWRTRMALAHKGIEAERVPVGFTEKDKIAFSGQDKVPVLKDGETVVSDSWHIACHLEDRYPSQPSLFGGAQGRSLARLVNYMSDMLHAQMARLIIGDVFSNVDLRDRDYFRKTREARFGKRIEDMHAERDGHKEAFTNALQPFRLTLREQPFLSGTAAAYADYILFGSFMWARITSPYALLAADDVVFAWRERMLDLFGGMARQTKEASS
jgi:glutathione S-transferase